MLGTIPRDKTECHNSHPQEGETGQLKDEIVHCSKESQFLSLLLVLSQLSDIVHTDQRGGRAPKGSQ